MDLVFIGLTTAVVFVGLIGVLTVILFAAGVLYGKWWWSGEERAYSGAWFQASWRCGRVWSWLKVLLRYQTPTPPAHIREAVSPSPVVFSCQPHGMLAVSAALAVFSGDLDIGRPTVLVVHSWYWWVPGLRELMLSLGCIDRRWTSIKHALEAGYNVALLPGGVFEMGPPAVPPPPVLRIMQHLHAYGKALLVPVTLQGEDATCWVWHTEPKRLTRLRAASLKRCHVGVGAVFVPRFWAWPTLQPIIGPPIDPTDCPTPGLLQYVYDKVRGEHDYRDAQCYVQALREVGRSWREEKSNLRVIASLSEQVYYR
jgi:Diacylglycerol acyltransferase